MAFYLQVSGVVGAFVRGRGEADWGVITHAFEAKSSEGNEVGRMLPSQRVVPPSSLTPIPLPLCPWLLTRVAPVPLVSSSPHAWTIGWASVRAWKWRPPQLLQPSRLPRATSSHFITLHQIKSNKLITNGGGHASSKYRINIIDLILSMLSEILINAGAKIAVLFSRSTATIGWIKRSHEVHSTKLNSSNANAIHTETLD